MSIINSYYAISQRELPLLRKVVAPNKKKKKKKKKQEFTAELKIGEEINKANFWINDDVFVNICIF